MLEIILIVSLKILAVWVCLQDGMIFGWLRHRFYNWLPGILHKPVFECLTCMGGLWTVIFWLLSHCKWDLLEVMLPVIGLNYLMAIWKDQFFKPYGEDHP